MASTRLASLVAFLRARFSPEGYLGLHLTVGALLLVMAAWLFGSIAEDVTTADTITVVDFEVARWFHAHRNPVLTKFMLFISDIHSVLGIILWSILTALIFIWKKDWYWLLGLAVSVGGGMLVNVLVKYAFHRARPSVDEPLLTLMTYSFPSGHTAGSMLFYGVLTAYLVCHVRFWRWQIPIVTIAVLMVVIVGISRMYLGVHYLSDVLAAIAESIAWLALSLTAISTLRRRNQVHDVNK